MTDQKEFLSRTLHDLRNPLSSILGYGELLEDLQTDPEAKKYAALVVNKARSMTLLMEQISDLFWAENGQPPAFTSEELDFKALAEYARERTESDSPGMAWIWGPSDSVKVRADRSKTRKVLQALFSNAALHGRSGGEIRLSLRAEPKSGILLLEDRGPGIPESVLERLGCPFNKGPGTSGSGLGLAWAKVLLEAQGGQLRAENTQQGSRIILTLPRA